MKSRGFKGLGFRESREGSDMNLKYGPPPPTHPQNNREADISPAGIRTSLSPYKPCKPDAFRLNPNPTPKP